MNYTTNTANFNVTNVRPANYNTHDYNKGDCSTRAMTYCLNGKMTYDEIEREQYRIGRMVGKARNAHGVWDKIMLDNGYVWLNLSSKVVRKTLAVILKNIATPIISHSRGHVAVIHNGMVKDTWNSTGGRVDNLLVSKTDCNVIMETLDRYGILSVTNSRCVCLTTHHRRRNYWAWG